MVLYIIATPIGNLKDITLRALEILKSLDLLLCEDTRVTKKLLDHYGIDAKVKSVHQHTSEGSIKKLFSDLRGYSRVGYVCDAGTPGYSDPGGKLVEIASSLGIDIVPVPGPSALSTIMSVADFPVLPLRVFGFVPHKKGRQKFLDKLINDQDASMFCESPYRILKTMEYLTSKDPLRRIVVGRELTKQFETIYRGTVCDVFKKIKKDPIKGEYSIIIGPVTG